jgi:LmbE family N-acetylglucosaminyl deacetylase
MTTLVCFHAHPDDEVIGTGGVMAKASAAGHRVVLVTATRGERGEVQPGVLSPTEDLWQRREREVAEAAAILGIHRQEFLGYVDSGMMGEPTNDDPACFWKAPIEEAADRLAALLTEEGADVITIYDANGLYGHPDHIQVHRVGVRAAEKVGLRYVYETTLDRDRMRTQLRETLEGRGPGAGSPQMVEAAREMLADGGPHMGSPGEQITTRVDVTPWLSAKRAAMKAHASQIGPESFFLAMPEEAFAGAFGTEHFILRGAPPGLAETDLAGLG